MQHPTARLRTLVICVVLAASVSGCGSGEPPPQAQVPATAQDAAATGSPAPVVAADVTRSWSPEALEELLAPIALYPDPVLSQILIASTNPQEVLDAGNWLLQNTSLEGNARDEAAAGVGFTPPVRALLQFPETVDMMCLELGWTTELGEAFVADQAGVLDAIQRLRRQSIEVGNLQSSAQMTVETTEQEGEEVVVLKPAQPEVVYVPQYDPVAAYAPAAPTTTPAATAAVADEDEGHSTGALITTGVLAFGAGILVNEIFDDDDHHKHKNDYYYPNYGYGGMPYYPPYPYRPVYGGGYYPSHGYNRPPNYNSGFQNSGTIIVNTGGNRPNGGYWDRYDNQPGAGGAGRPRTASSPISSARPDRPELAELNRRQPRAMPADVQRPSADATAANWKGQSSYAGAAQGGPRDASARIAQAQPGYSKPAAGKGSAKAPPKVQGTYAGAGPERSKAVSHAQPAATKRDLPKAPATSTMPRPDNAQRDRGYAKPDTRQAARPEAVPSARPTQPGGNRATAVSSAKTGKADRAASQRGKQSLPQGARSKGGGAGGGGKKKQR